MKNSATISPPECHPSPRTQAEIDTLRVLESVAITLSEDGKDNIRDGAVTVLAELRRMLKGARP